MAEMSGRWGSRGERGELVSGGSLVQSLITKGDFYEGPAYYYSKKQNILRQKNK